MISKKEYIKRYVIDRRSPLDRRTFNFGHNYPDIEQRMQQDRRQGWENRYEWKPINQWSSLPTHFNIS
jgi:hypothetical protein